jgi:hypothetical protein
MTTQHFTKRLFISILMLMISMPAIAQPYFYPAFDPDNPVAPITDYPGNPMHINCDMVELAQLAPGKRLIAITWDEALTMAGAGYQSYLQVIDESTGLTNTIALPQNSHSPDVVIADNVQYDGTSYFVAVVYVDQTGSLPYEVKMDVYEVTGITSSPLGLSSIGSETLGTSNKVVANPHIDMAAGLPMAPGTPNVPSLRYYAACWEYEPSPAQREIHGVSGLLIPPFTRTSFNIISTGDYLVKPDISCYYEESSMEYFANISYLNQTTSELLVDPYNISLTSWGTQQLTYSTSTHSAVGYPRIESQGYIVDLTDPEAAWSLVVGVENSGSPNPYPVLLFDQENNAIGDLAGYLNSDQRPNYNVAIAAGCGASAPGNPTNIGNLQYTTVILSENDASLFISPVPLDVSLPGGIVEDYYEVNDASLNNINLGVAISSSSNLGDGFLSVWCDGTDIWYKTNTGTMQYRNPTAAATVHKLKTPLRLYPNPAQNNITIKGLDKDASYSIYDILGHEIQTGIASVSQQINISSLSAGYYTMSIIENCRPQILRFIKH